MTRNQLRTEYIADALDFLSSITDEAWSCVMGQQDREEFARLCFDAGEDIADAWIEAVRHANTL
jgi:hypothetical protein